MPDSVSVRFATMSFVCACMVVGIHIGTQTQAGSVSWFIMAIIGGDGILRLAVPFFFLTSGYWMANSYANGRSYAEQVRRRIGSLLIPYLIWNVCWILFTYVTTRKLLVGSLSDVFSAFGFNIFERPAMGFLWFLRLLMILAVVSPLIYKIATKRWARLLLPVGFLLSGGLFMRAAVNKDWFLFFEYGICIEGLFCFFAGMVLRLHPLRMPQSSCWSVFFFLFGIFLFILRVVLLRADCAYMAYWSCWCGIITLMYGIWRILPLARLPESLQSSSFPVYLIHPFLVVLLAGGIRAAGLRDVVLGSPLLYLIRLLFVLTATILVVLVMRRAMPRVAAIVFGGR